MKPKISILDRAFAYKPSYATAIVETWRRFGWRPAKRNVHEAQARPRSASPLPTWHSERANNKAGSMIVETWRRFGWRPAKRNVYEAQARPRSASPLPTWHSERANNNGGSI